jgi:hypothetical protein
VREFLLLTFGGYCWKCSFTLLFSDLFWFYHFSYRRNVRMLSLWRWAVGGGWCIGTELEYVHFSRSFILYVSFASPTTMIC